MMAMITTEDIIEATGGELLSVKANSFTGISIDSRTISKGEVFFALRGKNFNGHDFLDDALMKGEGAVIGSRHCTIPEDRVIVYVQDTLRALQDLAHFLRMKKDIPVIAITGSNGKTTTKEMTYTILSRIYQVLKNEGNLNNHIGLPLSLAKITPDAQMVVLELGMNAPGEIKRLCEIAEPTHGIITNIGSAHIGELGSLEAVRDAKMEILGGLNVTVLNADDSFLMEGYRSFVESGGRSGKVITFSMRNDADVKADNVQPSARGSSFTLKLQNGKRAEITLNIHGMFNVYNALAAAAACLSVGISLDEIKTALESYAAFPMRFEVIKGERVTLINDSYNANPSSVEESLKELARMKNGGRAVAVLGDMAELGEFSEKAHRAVGRMVLSVGIDVFVAVGELMGLAAEESLKAVAKEMKHMMRPKIFEFKTADEAQKNLSNIIRDGDVVLVKGSRVMAMEKIMEDIRG
jgi:UDP-N-acetylmuramoyl-tripeptide--D-alanyl-D-alanine ligase